MLTACGGTRTIVQESLQPNKVTHTPSATHSYRLVWVATLLFYAAYYALLIPMPLYLTGIGLPDWQVSVILGAFAIASLFGRPIAGVLTDTWGRRQMLFMGAGSLLIGATCVSLTTQPALLFIFRILQASGHVAFTTAAFALVADLAPIEQRLSALAIFGIAANLSMSLIPAATNAILGLITLKGAFWLAGALAAGSGLLAGFIKTKPLEHKRPYAWRMVFKVERELILPMLISWLFGAGYGAFLQFLPLLAERRSLGPVGLAYTTYGVSIILTRVASGSLFDFTNRNRIMAAGFISLATGLAGFAYAGSLATLLCGVVLVGVGSGILHPALIAVHVDALPTERGRAVSDFYLAFDLGLGIGAWIMAPALQWFGITGLYVVAAVLSALGFLLVPRIQPPPSLEELKSR